jgi:hypothetical protein
MKYWHAPLWPGSFHLPDAISRTWVLLTIFVVLCNSSNAAPTSWPYFDMPKEITTFDISQHITANGMPMRIAGFVSSSGPQQAAALFRASMGQPLVENSLANKIILGRAQGERYLTVQLEPAGSGTRGIIAVADLRAALNQRNASLDAAHHLLENFPHGSQLVNQTSSVDRGQTSHHITLVNTYSPELNLGHIKTMMHDDGYVLERETADLPPLSAQQTTPARKAAPDSKILFFKGQSKEAIAMAFRNDDGRTAIIISTTTFTEPEK